MVRDYHRSAAENVGIGADAGDAAVTGSAFRAVAPVSAVCAAFRTQPSAYPPEATKPDVAPTCGSVWQSYSTEAGAPAGGFRRRNEPQAAKQEKRLGAFLRQPVHFCPQCGQFWAVKTALFCGGEKWISADFRKKPRSCRCCRHYFGAFHFWRG